MAPTTEIPVEIAGYNVLALSLPPMPSYPDAAKHFLYIGPHQPRIPVPTASRSLFLVNIPFDATEGHIKHLLSAQIRLPAGRIEDVQFECHKKTTSKANGDNTPKDKPDGKSKKRKRGNTGEQGYDFGSAALPSTWDRELKIEKLTGVVVFVDRASTDAALAAIKATRKKRIEPLWGEGLEGKTPALGSRRYLSHQSLRYPSKAQSLESVDKYMTAYAAKEASQKRLATKQRQEADEDGFVTVTRGGRTNPARQEAALEQAERQKEKQNGLEGFYRFQSREKRKERAAELVRKFEEDKEKVRKMRERRGRFRPE